MMDNKNIKLKPRRIQSIKYSFYINLPLIFIDNNHLKKQDLLEFELTPEKFLLIKPIRIVKDHETPNKK